MATLIDLNKIHEGKQIIKKFVALLPIIFLTVILVGNPLYHLYAQSNMLQVRTVSWRPDGQQLAIGTDQSFVRIYDSNAQTITEKTTVGQYIHHIAWSPDSTRIAVISSSNNIFLEIWDATTFNTLVSIGIVGSERNSFAWSPTGEFIVGSSRSDGVIWNTNTGEEVARLEGHFPEVREVYWHSGNQWILTGDGEDTIRVWNPADFSLIREFTNGSSIGFLTFAISPDEEYLALPTVIPPNDIGIWNIDTENLITSFDALDNVERSLDWGSQYLATLDAGNTIKIWDPNTWQLVETINLGELTLDMAWSPDGETLAYFQNDTIQLEEMNVSTPPSCTTSPTTSAELVTAINTANGTPEPDTICLTDSATYTFTTAHIPLNALPAITSELTIVGNGATLTRQAGAPLFGFFEVSAGGSLTLENLTLNGGDVGNDTGGALVNEGGTVTLNNVTFTNNHANTGGAIDNESGCADHH